MLPGEVSGVRLQAGATGRWAAVRALGHGQPVGGAAAGAGTGALLGRRYDPFGAISITAAWLVFVYAISQAPQAGWAAPQTVIMLIAGAAVLAVFFVIETKGEAPLLPLRLFRLRSVAGSNAAGFLLGTSFLTFVFVGTLYMQQVLGFSALATGAAWMTASVTSLACANFSQKIVTRTAPKAVMAAGIGTVFTFIPISIGALTGVTERDAGVASGLLNTSQNLGR